MSSRARPADCCASIVPARPLPEARLEQAAAVLRALADPTRLEILRLLAAQAGPVCVCDVVERFPLSQPTISHHLKVLREAGLVTVSRRGTWAYYAVDPRGLDLLRELADQLTPRTLSATG